MGKSSSLRAASISALVVSVLGGAVGVASAQSACTGGQTSAPFSFTGAAQTFTVPAFVTSAVVHVKGAQGGGGFASTSAQGAGGLGASVVGTLALTPGDTLNIFVGGAGSAGSGGFNGGAASTGGGGGGASDIRVGGVAEANRVVTAGGGGGGGNGGCFGNAVPGGAGGGGGGGAGVMGTNSAAGGGGFPGTVGTGGLNGIGCAGFSGAPGLSTLTGAGGSGGLGTGLCSAQPTSGGGGGGGFLGGGGGGAGAAGTIGCQFNDTGGGGGGAGGSSNASTLTSVTMTQGVNTGNGSVEVCYAPNPPVNGACGSANGVAIGAAPSANLCAAGTASVVASAASQFTWTCDGANGGTNASCAAPRTYTVTPSVSGGNGTATGGGTVLYNATGSVTITPNAGFFTTTPIGGTCDGTLAGGTFTTLPVTADCTVIASFTAQITPSVAASPSTGGSLSCTPQAGIGGTSTCTATPSPGYVLSSFSGCSGVQTGQTTYVTGPLSAACTVTAVFAPTAVIPVLTGWWAWLLAAFVAFAAFVSARRRDVSLR